MKIIHSAKPGFRVLEVLHHDLMIKGEKSDLRIMILYSQNIFKVKHHYLLHFFRTVRPHCAVRTWCGWTLIFFIAFLDELGNSKPFETYLFFG